MNNMNYPYCFECHATFPMRQADFDGYESSGKRFYCPQGHPLVISQSSVALQLRSRERLLRQSEDHIEVLRKSISGMKSVVTRQKNRLMRGVCPYCGKTSGSLPGHIRERHGG